MIDAPPQVDAPVYAKVDFYRGFPIFVNAKTGIVTIMNPKALYKPVRRVDSEKAARMWIEEVSEVK